MTYPRVRDEFATQALALAGYSLARYGDGELNIVAGGKSISQAADPRLTAELRAILAGQYGERVIPCIPRFWPESGRPQYFLKYRSAPYTSFYKLDWYGSVFISRPEVAPHIDNAAYWDAWRTVWRGKHVAYVSGDDRLYRVMKDDARKITWITAPARDAYAQIERIHSECLHTRYDAVVIALGAAGTALAARLGRDGMHALDLGHMGMFMLNPGAYEIPADDLASPEYRALLKHQHATTHWGKGGHSWAAQIHAYANKIGAEDVLDYGCGSGTLKPALRELGVKCNEYDPGIIGKDNPPKLADLVVSTDVFEHIEPEKVDSVLLHTFRLARKGGFFAIAKQPAKAILKDGRNAHLTCQETKWWVKRLRAAGWEHVDVVTDEWKKCLILCRK